MRKYFSFAAGGPLLLIVSLLVSCQTMGFFGGESTVPAEKRITLEPGGPHAGTTDTADLTVAYEYRLVDPMTLQLSGRISGLQWRADSVSVSVMFTDAAGLVIKRQLLFATGYRRSTYEPRTWSFDHKLQLPPGTAAMAFSSLVQESSGHR